MTVYTCAMCKERQIGEPVFKNNAGMFCAKCKQEMNNRSAEGIKQKHAEWDGLCEYCGIPITAAKPSSSMIHKQSSAKYVHYECEQKREWMLKCIRHSNKLADYVSKTELREKDEREKRIAEKNKTQSQQALSFDSVSKPNSDQLRIDRIEKMLEKLTAALGGV